LKRNVLSLIFIEEVILYCNKKGYQKASPALKSWALYDW